MMLSDFETELLTKGTILYTNVGDSMNPMIKQGRDVLIIKRPKEWNDSSNRKLKKGDVALYKRDNGQYLLHRVIKVRENDYVFSADNRRIEEFGITDDKILGILTGIIRNGKELSQEDFSNTVYKKYTAVAHAAKVIKHKIKKRLKNG